jgi:2,4-dichlorophenol 6-monooxygenase
MIETDVLVVGAGPAGLTASALLARAGVRSMTVTKYEGTADSPRAHITNQRTMEVLRDLGIEGDVVARAMPQDKMGTQIFATSFTGKEISRTMTWGAGLDRRHEYERSSPSAMCNIPQHVLEPIILKSAVEYGAQIRFGTELVAISQNARGVKARVRERSSGNEYDIDAKYAIGADGARSVVGEQLGFVYEGEVALGEAVSVWLKADLSRYTAHRSGAIAFICHPGSEIWMSVWPCVNAWDEWNPFFLRYHRARGEASEDVLRQHISAAIGDPSIEFEIKKITRWQVNHMVAANYRQGRVFLAGDAAHRHPPANGLGSNTSIQDSYNLVWKLALVLAGKAKDSLLDSYSAERQPVGRRVIDRAIKSQKEMLPWSDAVGLRPDQTQEEAWRNIEDLFGDTDAAAHRRTAILAGLKLMDGQFNAHGVELGQYYTSQAIVDDTGVSPPDLAISDLHYTPTTRPGAHLPHVWLQRGAQRVSTLDLADYESFTLITGIGGQAWSAVASEASSALGITINCLSVGLRQDNDDVLGEWTSSRDIGDTGCVLVRPDRFVAWRAQEATDEALAAFRDVMMRILGRSRVNSRVPDVVDA